MVWFADDRSRHPGVIQASVRRDRRARWTVVAALGAVTVLAWAYLVDRANGMTDMTVMDEMTRLRPWTPAAYGVTLLMWVVMMIGMMVPSAVPMTLVFAAVARKARSQGSAVPATFVFVSGYVAVWAAFSVAATTGQPFLERAALLSSTLVSTSGTFGGALLVAAGVYQITPFKRACLRNCRGPADFLVQHWQSSTLGVFSMGIRAGLYCLGCCWLLMALLFVGGVMNLLWVAVIAFFVLVEKVMWFGEPVARFAGVALILVGTAVLTNSAGLT